MQPSHLKVQRRSSRDTEGDVQHVLARLESRNENATLLRLLANSDVLFRPFVQMTRALLANSTLSRRTVEIVILWVGNELRVSYELLEHTPLALANDVSQTQIDALEADNADADLFEQKDLLAIEVARQLLSARTIRPETFDAAVQTWGIGGTLDLLATVGWWGGTVRMLIEGLGLVRPDSSADAGPSIA